MKLAFVHCNFDYHGVTRVVLNNVRGLREAYPGIDIKLVGESFEGVPDDIKTEKVVMGGVSPNVIAKNLKYATRGYRAIVENALLGASIPLTRALQKFSEEKEDPVLCRHHDIIDDRKNSHEKFLKSFGTFDNPYARTSNVSHATLTGYDQERLRRKGIEAEVLPNSIILDDFKYDPSKAKDFRKFLEEKKIIFSGEEAIVTPGRVIGRKKIEESFLITKFLQLEGGNPRLIVTLNYEPEKDYRRKVVALAEEHDIPCSLGQAGKYIGMGREGYTVSNLLSMAEVALTTSDLEGFGFVFIESNANGKPLIGRDIPSVTEDFKRVGMKLDPLYGEEDLPAGEDVSTRMEEIDSLLGDEPRLRRLARRLDLPSRIEEARRNVPHNAEVIRDNYGHVEVAKRLHDILEGAMVY